MNLKIKVQLDQQSFYLPLSVTATLRQSVKPGHFHLQNMEEILLLGLAYITIIIIIIMQFVTRTLLAKLVQE